MPSNAGFSIEKARVRFGALLVAAAQADCDALLEQIENGEFEDEGSL